MKFETEINFYQLTIGEHFTTYFADEKLTSKDFDAIVLDTLGQYKNDDRNYASHTINDFLEVVNAALEQNGYYQVEPEASVNIPPQEIEDERYLTTN